MLNADNLKFRASSMGDIMTGVAKGWGVDQSVTCKRKLVQNYRELKYGRKPKMQNKYTEKGTLAEEDGITLYSRYKKINFTKNSIRLENDFFTGELDIFEGTEITKAKRTHDIKCSWDIWTFPAFFDTTEKDYEYQGDVYMDLSSAESHTVAHCLVNTPAKLILDEKRKLAWKMGIIDEETPEYVSECIEIEKNSIFDMELFAKHNPYFEFHSKKWDYDIPISERVHEITMKRNQDNIISMYQRIKDCREWMNENLFKVKTLTTV